MGSTQSSIGTPFSFPKEGNSRTSAVRGVVLEGAGTDANGVRMKAIKDKKRFFLNLKPGTMISSWFPIYMSEGGVACRYGGTVSSLVQVALVVVVLYHYVILGTMPFFSASPNPFLTVST